MPILIASGGSQLNRGTGVGLISKPVPEPARRACNRTIDPQVAEQTRWQPDQLGSMVKAWLQGNSLAINPIAAWDDQSGNGNGVSGAGSADLTSLNGMNAALFVSANSDGYNWLNTGAFTEGAMFYVAKTTTNALTGLPAGRMGVASVAERYKDGGVEGVVSSNFLTTVGKTTGAVFGDASTWHIAGFLSKASDWRLRRDGVDVFTTATNTVGSAGTTSFLGIGEGPVFFDGSLAEIVLLDSFPTLADQQRIEGYLAHKWNLAAALDAGHPYKTEPPNVTPVSPIAGTADLTFTTSATATGAGALSGATTLTFSPSAIIKGLAPVSGAANVAFTTAGAILGLANTFGASSLTFSTAGIITGRGALTGATTATFTTAGNLAGSGALAGASTLTFAPVGILRGAGPRSGASTLTFTTAGALAGGGALSGASSLTFAATGNLTGSAAAGDISGATALALSTTGNLQASVALAGTVTITFTPAGNVVALAGGISGSASFGFSLTGALVQPVAPPRRIVTRLGAQGSSSIGGRSYGSGNARRSGSGSARSYRTSRGR